MSPLGLGVPLSSAGFLPLCWGCLCLSFYSKCCYFPFLLGQDVLNSYCPCLLLHNWRVWEEREWKSKGSVTANWAIIVPAEAAHLPRLILIAMVLFERELPCLRGWVADISVWSLTVWCAPLSTWGMGQLLQLRGNHRAELDWPCSFFVFLPLSPFLFPFDCAGLFGRLAAAGPRPGLQVTEGVIYATISMGMACFPNLKCLSKNQSNKQNQTSKPPQFS